jgi:hypothetical protein
MIQKAQEKNIQPWIVSNITTKGQRGNKSYVTYHKKLENHLKHEILMKIMKVPSKNNYVKDINSQGQ